MSFHVSVAESSIAPTTKFDVYRLLPGHMNYNNYYERFCKDYSGSRIIEATDKVELIGTITANGHFNAKQVLKNGPTDKEIKQRKSIIGEIILLINLDHGCVAG